LKSPSECGWKPGDTEATWEERQLGRHVDLLTIKAFSWKPLGGSGSEPSALTRRAVDGLLADSASQAKLPSL
jgi:hypothetical protein